MFFDIPVQSVRFFLDISMKRNAIPFFLKPGSFRIWGIQGIPAGMHNLVTMITQRSDQKGDTRYKYHTMMQTARCYLKDMKKMYSCAPRLAHFSNFSVQ